MNPFMLKNPYKMHKYTTKINGAPYPKTTPPKMFCLDASLRGGIVLIWWENFDAAWSQSPPGPGCQVRETVQWDLVDGGLRLNRDVAWHQRI